MCLFYSQQVCSDGGHDEDLALTVGHRSPYRYLHQQCTSDVLYKLVRGENSEVISLVATRWRRWIRFRCVRFYVYKKIKTGRGQCVQSVSEDGNVARWVEMLVKDLLLFCQERKRTTLHHRERPRTELT